MNIFHKVTVRCVDKEMSQDDRPFREDIENKSADELIEMYSIIIKRAVGSKDETYIPDLNGTIKDATLRLLELGVEINAVYDEYVKENKERKRREVIDLVEMEHKEKLDGCEMINNLLSSTKKRKKKSSNTSLNNRVRLFSHGGITPPRNGRSGSDPVQNRRTSAQRPKRSHSDGDAAQEKNEYEEEEEDDENDYEQEEDSPPRFTTIKIEKYDSTQKRGPGRPPKNKDRIPRMLDRLQ
jgi:hypothetical protein